MELMFEVEAEDVPYEARCGSPVVSNFVLFNLIQ